MRALMLALVLLALSGCGPAEDCRDVCATLILDCDMGTWTDSAQCTQGCDDELFRHPAREQVIGCYSAASESCDLIGLLQCRHEADLLAAEVLGSLE